MSTSSTAMRLALLTKDERALIQADRMKSEVGTYIRGNRARR